MTEKPDEEPHATQAMPQPHPPRGGPGNDPDSPNPADLVPGLGGDTETQPESTEEE